MSQVANNTYKLKRGLQAAVERVNPILEAGEPITVFCNDGITRLKIGDGIHTYKELNFIGDNNTQMEILTFPSRFDFPNPPKTEQQYYLYKASNEATLYRWNPTKVIYDAIDVPDVNLTLDDIETINGGSVSALLG
jgi:hypothetical protein